MRRATIRRRRCLSGTHRREHDRPRFGGVGASSGRRAGPTPVVFTLSHAMSHRIDAEVPAMYGSEFGIGAYTPTETAKLLHMQAVTLRRWLCGYRSEERRIGTEGVSPDRSRGWP